MNDYKYIVNGIVFESNEGKHNAKRRATAYCKKNDISEGEMLEVRNEVELKYIQQLKNVKFLSTHEKMVVQQCFNNAVGQYIPAFVIDVPFHYVDDNGIHYEWVIGDKKELNQKLVDSKMMFDKFYVFEKYYLKLIYLDTDGTFKEFLLTDIEELRLKFRKAEHKEMLKSLAEIRARQTYDRLLKLREEGRITQSQTKALYKLEERYGK